ncbi:MAG: hypothetical protein HYT80_05660 [Euryarchaeota archaeon]|nr:hypothetical protein [Euryarchaeota archaeon]
MARNRRFGRDEAGIAPVIATVLAVAITIALAITVWLIIDKIDKSGSKPPAYFGVKPWETDDRLEIISVGADADWARVEMSGDQAFRYSLNDAAGVDVPAATFVSLSSVSVPMSGGDKIELCAQSGTLADFRVELRDSISGNAIGKWRFQNVMTGNCP